MYMYSYNVYVMLCAKVLFFAEMHKRVCSRGITQVYDWRHDTVGCTLGEREMSAFEPPCSALVCGYLILSR